MRRVWQKYAQLLHPDLRRHDRLCRYGNRMKHSPIDAHGCSLREELRMPTQSMCLQTLRAAHVGCMHWMWLEGRRSLDGKDR